ncbi:MAG: hypothetical protein M1833_003939 [Piccolia ochrophora]|nr:MAG: hypothetical protein M1833_003939 [Piccolia ochrophora]
MGNDGGSIPTRRELVKEAARTQTTAQLKETQQEQQTYNWTTCPVSHRPLTRPVVSDCAGKLYNKDAILEFLLPAQDEIKKVDAEEVLKGRVKTLKDVVEIKFEMEQDESPDTNDKVTAKREKWVCPITRKELGPAVKSVYLVPCGHAFSETAVKEVSGDSCLQCSEPYTTENEVAILPTNSMDIDKLVIRANDLRDRGLTHSLKKLSGSTKKRKKNSETAALDVSATPLTGDAEAAKSNQNTSDKAPSESTIKNAATASLTARVLEDEKARKKRQKLTMNDNLKGLFSGKDSEKPARSGDFMTRGYSIPTGAKR